MRIFDRISSKQGILLLISLTTASLFLRLYMLGNIPPALYFDEISAAFTPFLAHAGIVKLSPLEETSLLMEGSYFSYILFGTSAFFLRILPAIYGTLLVPVMYFLSKRMFGIKVAFLAGLIAAIVPWSFIFSRYLIQAIDSVFWLTLGIYLLYLGLESQSRKKFIFLIFGGFVLGLSINSQAEMRIFIPIFLIGFLILKIRWRPFRVSKAQVLAVLPFSICFIMGALPTILAYATNSSASSLSLDQQYSIFSYATNVFSLIQLIAIRFALHLDPNFLVLNGGSWFVNYSAGVLAPSNYSTGIVGMLNYFGILVYPGIALLFYRAIKRKNSNSNQSKIILWWIFSYAIASGFAFWDNPNAPRNIDGLPSLIITIAVMMEWIHIHFSRLSKIPFARFISVIAIALLICLPTAYFFDNYFTTYPKVAEPQFQYGFQEVASYLTRTNQWNDPILLCCSPVTNWNLAFYSPNQPFDPNRISTTVSLNDFARYISQKDSWAISQMALSESVEQLDFAAMIDHGYGSATSFGIILMHANINNSFALSVYSQNSTYTPNHFLMSQKVNGNSSFMSSEVDSNVTADKWYHVALTFSSNISLSINDKLVATWQNMQKEPFNYVKLIAESSAVSFANATAIQISGSAKNFTNLIDLNVSKWQVLSGYWTFNGESLTGGMQTIFIIECAGQDCPQAQQLFQSNNVSYDLNYEIDYSNDSLAFAVFTVWP